MRIRPRLKSIVRNKETSKLPYWVEDEYSDFQQLTSQKYIQDNYGKFPESEFQQPYKLDEEDDYQFLEYLYSVPEFPTIPIPDVDVTKTRPKGNCEELWRELFGDSKVPFIPDESDWSKIRKYAEKCPLEYLPHICCKDMKINGPTVVTPGQTVEYTVTGGLPGCAYSWKSGKGRMAEGTYTAPDTSGTDEISVSPWMSDDQDKKCAKKSITIGEACNGVISYTTLQMQVSTTQTLTVTGAVEGETYSWSTTSGSIVPTEGTSVTYTAPASNANCASNPTITLTCGGNVVDTITIAVNAVTTNAYAYGVKSGYVCVGPWKNGDYKFYSVTATSDQYRCDGSRKTSGDTCNTITITGHSSCRLPWWCQDITCDCAVPPESSCDLASLTWPYTICDNLTYALPNTGGIVDLRGQYITGGGGAKYPSAADGCCPAALL